MKYLMQIRFNGSQALMQGLPAHERAQIMAEFQTIRQLPGVLDGNELEPAASAKTVRVNDRETIVSDGPAAPTGRD